jgi:hypothetical protein
MKKCSYCGKEYPDDATMCALDGEPLVGAGESASLLGTSVVPADLNDPVRAAGKHKMLVGGLWCVGGIVVTAVSYGAASGPGGGGYVFAWGAILFGGIKFFTGLAMASGKGRPNAAAKAPVKEKKPWTCGMCGEVLDPQFTTCWKCRTPKPDSAN